jgi:hypothetical protein
VPIPGDKIPVYPSTDIRYGRAIWATQPSRARFVPSRAPTRPDYTARQSHSLVAMQVETKFPRLYKPSSIGDRIKLVARSSFRLELRRRPLIHSHK